MKDYVAFDLETTGLSPDSDQIIEIGAVRIRDGKISGKYNCIIPVSYTHLTLPTIA